MRIAALLPFGVLALAMGCSFGFSNGEFSGGAAPTSNDGGEAGQSSSSGGDSGGGTSSGDSGGNASSSSGDSGPAPTACANAGDVCSDGSVLAGRYPADTSISLYTTPCDFGQSPGGPSQPGVCLNQRVELPYNDGNSEGGVFVDATSSYDGINNATKLVAADANGMMSGKQGHQAAVACSDLIAHGHDDWYLPSIDELEVMYFNRAAIKRFLDTGADPPYYKSSTETHGPGEPLNHARLKFSNGYVYGDGDGKPNEEPFRCVRRAK
jgi:hypothetical protein